MSRNKGHGFEREVASILRAFYPEARRGIGQARSAGEVCDVEGTPWWVESKFYKSTMPVLAAYRQSLAAKAADPATGKKFDTRPVLIVSKVNNVTPLVTMELESFLAILQRLADVKDSGCAKPQPDGSGRSEDGAI